MESLDFSLSRGHSALHFPASRGAKCGQVTHFWPVSCKCEGVYNFEGFTLKGEQRALHHLCPHSAGRTSGMVGPGEATLEHEVETVC